MSIIFFYTTQYLELTETYLETNPQFLPKILWKNSHQLFQYEIRLLNYSFKI